MINILQRYRCGSRPKGLALIINIREYEDTNHAHRRGAEFDDKNLEELFKQLGYETEVHLDLNKKVNYYFILRLLNNKINFCN
jgi:hypothetical protein